MFVGPAWRGSHVLESPLRGGVLRGPRSSVLRALLAVVMAIGVGTAIAPSQEGMAMTPSSNPLSLDAALRAGPELPTLTLGGGLGICAIPPEFATGTHAVAAETEEEGP